MSILKSIKMVGVVLLAFSFSVASHQLSNNEKVTHPKLKQQLLKIGTLDQQERAKMDETVKANGFNSKEMKELFAKQRILDQQNLAQIIDIFEQYGFPGKTMVGKKAANAAFMVIQHSPLESQKQYIELIRAAVLKKEFSARSFALLEDRVLMGEGKPQIYGSQLQSGEDGKLKLWKITDEANVDFRRAAVGLEPLADYLKHFGMDYKGPQN
jgi:hypothetical protein